MMLATKDIFGNDFHKAVKQAVDETTKSFGPPSPLLAKRIETLLSVPDEPAGFGKGQL